jgi:tetratricopeptide (TPR) repeat protein
MLHQAVYLSLLTAFAATPSVIAQGIPAGASISGQPILRGPPAAAVLVTTPYPSNTADSADAVAIGNSLRDRLAHGIDGGQWHVISAMDIGNSLTTFGYGRDALLATDQARALAKSFNARVLVLTSLSKGSDAHYVATVRVAGISDPAGEVVKLTQASGQSLGDFGSKLGDQATAVFKAYPDARLCSDQAATAPQKATDAAGKAIKQVPSYGYAEYCLGTIAQQKDSTSQAALQDFKAATVGDPLSLNAVNQLAVIHDRLHDSTAVVNDFQQMLVIAPTNRDLANRAFQVFQGYRRPDAAQQVVDQQIALDPTNPDWQELKGNSCAAEAAGDTNATAAAPKFQCAYQAFNQEFTLDPARVDSIFFQKIIYVAGSAQDSLKWARTYAAKFPASTTPLEVLATLYGTTGQTDSAIAVVNRLIEIDPTDSRPVLAVTQALMQAHHDSAALQLVPVVKKYGDANLKNAYTGILITFADSASQRAADSTKHTPADDSTMAILARATLDVAPPDSTRSAFAQYFLVRAGFNGFVALSAKVRADKSCDELKQYTAYLDEYEPHVTAITSDSNASLASYAAQVEGAVQQERKAIGQMQPAFCK